ncbi:hypothetical protein TNCV_2485411 [Trichonephila clavipes]|uniref:DUF5641 domain-containing protein n=1 Tax=Trichonephila clavipes TaxID=2585209 RepID=A0A8X6W046_TRICX|nr:hypothetical protein TNCV_2485411 [Trichonephila clavipes]
MIEKDNVMCGTMVIVKEDFTPVCNWLLGRVVEVYHGSDGKEQWIIVRHQKYSDKGFSHELFECASTQQCRFKLILGLGHRRYAGLLGSGGSKLMTRKSVQPSSRPLGARPKRSMNSPLLRRSLYDPHRQTKDCRTRSNKSGVLLMSAETTMSFL